MTTVGGTRGSGPAGEIRLTAAELAHPSLPWPIRAANALPRPAARTILPLDPAALERRARGSARLDDFGGDAYREPLAILCRALEEEARLTPLGRFAAWRQIGDLLTTRLRVIDLLRRRPEILDERVAAPIVVLGMPRTGTTLLHRLLASDPGLRSLPYWEALSPLPDGDPTRRDADPAPRIRRAAQSLRFLHWCAPHMLAMHEMAPEAPDEEIWLLAIDFATMLFEASYEVPSFRDWYDRADLTASYGFLGRLLAILQWYRPAERWVLKSPQHLGQIRPLLAAFPDAIVVQTHRDPVAVVGSFASMASYGRRMSSAAIDPRAIARTWTDRIDLLLRRSAEDRPADGAGRFVDVRFRELMADPIGTVRTIYAAAGRPLTAEAETCMRAFLAANPRGKHGAHAYRLEEFGLDAAEIRERFRGYRERFEVRDEQEGRP